MIAVVRLAARPWTVNSERSGSLWEHRRNTKTTLESTRWILRSLRLPVFTRVHVLAQFQCWGNLPDTGNNYPTLKAMLDAVVAEHLLADDKAQHVASVTMLAPTSAERYKQGSILILNDTDRNLFCEDCNQTVDGILAADAHGGACLCAKPHEGIDKVPQPKRGRR